MVAITPYLSVKSVIKAAELYKKIFNAELVERMPVEKEQGMAMGLPADTDFDKLTMHSTIKIGDALFFAADVNVGRKLSKTNVALLITPDNLKQAQTYFKNAEKNKCQITMPLEKQFWGDYFGSFTDPFGISWQCNFSPPK